MVTAALRSALGVRYRQLEGRVGGMIGASNTPVFSQLYKRISRLDADISRDPGGVVTVSDKRGSRILALDASGLKQHNRGEWMRAKWRVRRGFVKMHVLVDTETKRILALKVTDDSVGDSSMFGALLGQVVNADGAGGACSRRPRRPPAAASRDTRTFWRPAPPPPPPPARVAPPRRPPRRPRRARPTARRRRVRLKGEHCNVRAGRGGPGHHA